MIGPENPFSRQLHAEKYRADGETFDDFTVRYARATADRDDVGHFRGLLDALRNMRLLPAGRQQIAVGRPYQTTAFNCFVMGTIADSTEGIFQALKESAMTLRSGGGIGMDFSTLRPVGEPIRGLGAGAYASGPLSFMQTWDAMCGTIMSAGHRRGAMMGVMRVDHPDIEKFVRAKRDQNTLRNFNISVAITNAFMEAVDTDGLFELRFGDRSYGTIRALDLWAVIMENNWDWAEPGVLFIDRINAMNPLSYCERIAASNPCAEQMLPPYGACLLGSLNIARYVVPKHIHAVGETRYEIDMDLLARDVTVAVRAFDNVIDRTCYPLPQQEREAKAKRRMGLGVTGMANALEICGYPYGSEGYIKRQGEVLAFIQRHAVLASVDMAKTKGAFERFDADGWLSSGFAQALPDDLRGLIGMEGLRNGQLLSIAPTGTISLCADNVSSGIEPPYAIEARRRVRMTGGEVEVDVRDYAFEKFGVKGRTAQEILGEDHVRVLCEAQRYIDSAVSKTINVRGAPSSRAPEAGEVTFADFKGLYLAAYRGGAKGCTTFNIAGKRFGILAARSDEPAEEAVPSACFIDDQGRRECA